MTSDTTVKRDKLLDDRVTTEPTVTSSREPLLSIHELAVNFKTESGIARAVDGVDFDVRPGEVLGLVGESGSGKSVTALSILRLIPDPPGKIISGSVNYGGQNLLTLSSEEIRHIRGNEISMIFQEPMTSLNPVFTVGFQITEAILEHRRGSRQDALEHAVEMLNLVGIPEPRERMDDFPHLFSGGMRQRVMIAMALACKPALLIADEPTTALDVTIQAQILELMLDIRTQQKNSAILLITHDLAVIAETCDRVMVMYGGKIQEIAPVREIFNNPLHPYTKGLLNSLPSTVEKTHRLRTIPGTVPSIHDLPTGCKFCTRCDEKLESCETVEPELLVVSPSHSVRCHLMSERQGSQ